MISPASFVSMTLLNLLACFGVRSLKLPEHCNAGSVHSPGLARFWHFHKNLNVAQMESELHRQAIGDVPRHIRRGHASCHAACCACMPERTLCWRQGARTESAIIICRLQPPMLCPYVPCNNAGQCWDECARTSGTQCHATLATCTHPARGPTLPWRRDASKVHVLCTETHLVPDLTNVAAAAPPLILIDGSGWHRSLSLPARATPLLAICCIVCERPHLQRRQLVRFARLQSLHSHCSSRRCTAPGHDFTV